MEEKAKKVDALFGAVERILFNILDQLSDKVGSNFLLAMSVASMREGFSKAVDSVRQSSSEDKLLKMTDFSNNILFLVERTFGRDTLVDLAGDISKIIDQESIDILKEAGATQLASLLQDALEKNTEEVAPEDMTMQNANVLAEKVDAALYAVKEIGCRIFYQISLGKDGEAAAVKADYMKAQVLPILCDGKNEISSKDKIELLKSFSSGAFRKSVAPVGVKKAIDLAGDISGIVNQELIDLLNDIDAKYLASFLQSALERNIPKIAPVAVITMPDDEYLAGLNDGLSELTELYNRVGAEIEATKAEIARVQSGNMPASRTKRCDGPECLTGM